MQTQDWFVETFNDSKSVLEIKDKENGILKGKAVFDMLAQVDLYLHGKHRSGNCSCTSTFVIGVAIKDGKCKIDVNESNRETKPGNLRVTKKVYDTVSGYSDIICVNYDNFIKSSKKSDF